VKSSSDGNLCVFAPKVHTVHNLRCARHALSSSENNRGTFAFVL
jgi:hypothetical protein